MFYRFCWICVVWLLRIIYPVKVFCKKKFIKKGKCVGICNHYTNFDVPIVASRFWRQFHFIAKKELFEKKFGAWFYRHLGAIPVDRERMDLSTVKAALGVLKKEELLMLFPEGTRNKENTQVQGVKAGAAMFAAKGKAPVVPMVFHHPPKAFKRNYLLIGDALDFSEYYDKKLKPEDLDALGNQIFEAMDSLHNQLEELIAKKRKKKEKA